MFKDFLFVAKDFFFTFFIVFLFSLWVFFLSGIKMNNKFIFIPT